MNVLSLPEIPSFERLQEGLIFEAVGKGRSIAILVDATANAAPVVRTTTIYEQPAQMFTEPIRELISRIRQAIAQSDSAQRQFTFNNAMCEVYTCDYRKMGFHCDQATDLEPGSAIAIFSVYDSVDSARRKLVVEDKATGVTVEEIVLEHGRVVWFDLEANGRLRHKIVLVDNNHSRHGTGRWFGITLRQSKLFVDHRNLRLRLATDAERVAFLRLRAEENRTVGEFAYPVDLNFTISPSDLLPVVGAPNADEAAESRQSSGSCE
jgi:hypothetical protein